MKALVRCKDFKGLIGCIENNKPSLMLVSVVLTQKDVCRLAEAIKKSSSLQRLFLSFNNIGCEGASILADALKANESLLYLYLSKNNIGVKGSIALADALKANKTLQIFKFCSNRIGDEGAKAFINALEVNKSLKALNLNGNNISDDIIRDLEHTVLASNSILEWDCDGKYFKQEAKYELNKRYTAIKDLITKWNNEAHHSNLSDYMIAALYHNMCSIKYVSDNENAQLGVNFPEFAKCLSSIFYVRYSVVGVLLSQSLPSDLVNYTMCFWAQLPFNIKSDVSNIPGIKVQTSNYYMVNNISK